MRSERRTYAYLDRRGFLRLCSGAVLGGAIAGSPLLLAGCGGGHKGGGNNNGGGGGGQTVSDATRAASLQAILGQVNSVASNPDRTARRSAIAAFLKGRPEFLASDVNEDGVWAIYQDLVPLMVLDNRPADPADQRGIALPPALGRGTEVPASKQARVINAMGNAFTNETPIVRPFLEDKGYRVVTDPGTVESLRGVRGDGFFYMSAHGGVCEAPLLDQNGNALLDDSGNIRTYHPYGIWTATAVDLANPNQYLTEQRAGRLGYGVATQSIDAGGNDVDELHYWITPLWVQRYMFFEPDSVVWFSACSSESAAAQPFVQACLSGNAGLYVGWTNSVDSAACVVTARFILDRLTGDNTANPKEDPPQRSFDYQNVWADLTKRGLNVHPSDAGSTTQIVYTANPASQLGLLAPSIANVWINELEDQAVLYGQFGTPAESERHVYIGGVERQADMWSENAIYCTIPRQGPGSAGDVQVVVRDHESNVRRITAWDLNMRCRHTQHGTLKVEGTIKYRFRMDIGTFREKIGEAPTGSHAWTFGTQDAKMELTASGTYHRDEYTETWSGSATFPAFNASGPNGLVTHFGIDTDLHQAGLTFGTSNEQQFTSTVNGNPREFNDGFDSVQNAQWHFQQDLATGNVVPPATLPALILNLDDNFGIVGDAHEVEDGFDTYRIEWDSAPAAPLPDPQAARAAPRTR